MREYEKSTSIDNLIELTLQNLQQLSSTNTVFGESVRLLDGTTIIPVSKVNLGFIVGGGEYADLSTRRVGQHYPMAGGSGGGINLTPVGFIVCTDTEIKYIQTSTANSAEKIIENITKLTSMAVKKMEKDDETENN